MPDGPDGTCGGAAPDARPAQDALHGCKWVVVRRGTPEHWPTGLPVSSAKRHAGTMQAAGCVRLTGFGRAEPVFASQIVHHDRIDVPPPSAQSYMSPSDDRTTHRMIGI